MDKSNQELVLFSVLSVKAYKFITLKLATRLHMIKNKQKNLKIPHVFGITFLLS